MSTEIIRKSDAELVTHDEMKFVPAVIAQVGPNAAERFLTFFTDQYPNPNTRMAYYRAAKKFYERCEFRGLTFADIRSFHISAYLTEMLQHPDENERKSKATAKQALTTIRGLYDWFILGQILDVNPAQAVKGPKVVREKGTTPFLEEDEAKLLIKSIDTSTVVGQRDRAIIGVMTYTFARVGDMVGLNVDDYYHTGERWRLKLRHMKGGKDLEPPVCRKLQKYLDAYIEAPGIAGQKKTPLFRTVSCTFGRNKTLTEKRMNRTDVWRMIRRRAKDAGINALIGCHTFRATGITNFRKNGGSLNSARQMAGHASERTTRMYDRTDDDVSLDEYERISI